MGRRVIDLTGRQFGDLLVITRAPAQDTSGKAWWACKCLSCGNVHLIRSDNLTSGTVFACGCMRGKSSPKDFT